MILFLISLPIFHAIAGGLNVSTGFPWHILAISAYQGLQEAPFGRPWSLLLIKAEGQGSLSTYGQDSEISSENNFNSELIFNFLIQLLASSI